MLLTFAFSSDCMVELLCCVIKSRLVDSLILANNPNAIATYSDVSNGQTYLYSTDVEDEANGELAIKNGAIQKPGTISGTFRFDAPYIGDILNAPERINFQEGVFYEIPITFGPVAVQ